VSATHIDLNRIMPSSDSEKEAVANLLDDQYTYHPWTADQVRRGHIVRDVLKAASQAIIENVPPCSDRTTALRKLREARMDANAAITHGGRF
jgi:hypothetical protein